MTGRQDYFSDGAAYDRTMGRLSRVAGRHFLDWLALPNGLRWLDVGCGTGAFTELILGSNDPAAISAIDPSADQVAIARRKSSADKVDYRKADAMALPFDDDTFDVAVMALVIQYIPDRTKAMAELVRCVRKDGLIAAYVWPGRTEGHPYQPLYEATDIFGGSGGNRPGTRIRTIDALVELFGASGLRDVDSRALEIRLEFEDFEDYWAAQARDLLVDLAPADVARVKAALKERLPARNDGRIAHMARANAVRGRVSV